MKRTGVIIGVEQMPRLEFGEFSRELATQLEEAFPGVTFALIAGGQSIAFEYDDNPQEEQ